ncbi:MerR family transcriptional regulator [Joostella atrarenae]|uniref:MerR family transcriptional regulator n=1 Tax=Joostella atrarenae TaxID=679257 RepID=A0ABS9J3F3_9FLAO|nr:MerR family transcriptional regulator [Joostella atrarenae]MCF8714934.1 MerR family transcriptional regulator [Joostella atrarenae]
MNIVKENFSIKDLENLSGIKAHTIRIWEKRYNLLEPERTETNIRFYSLKNLQKLLNITSLYNNGYKISKIAKISDADIQILVREISSKNTNESHILNDLKMAMMNFDQALFYAVYNNLLAERSFREVFFDVFIPFLEELGMLWQTATITPAHEHFITHLIKQKIIINTEKLQQANPTNNSKVFVLFLPDNEIHEIGLLYLNYEIMLRGYKSIYLGQTLPIHGLQNIANHHENIIFLSYFTISPAKELVETYLEELNDCINTDKKHDIWVLGHQIINLELSEKFDNVTLFHKINEAIERL